MKVTQVNFDRILLSFLLIPLFFFLIQCSVSKQPKAKLEFYNSGKKKSFSFIISDKFALESKNSAPDSSFPKMKKSEMKLLIKLLRESAYCLDGEGNLSFVVRTRQEKIYDVTFSSLVGQNYNIKPISPVTYFGDCI